MQKVYIDTDVTLGFLLGNTKQGEYAARIFSAGERGELALFVASLSFSNIYYVTRKFVGKEKALELLNHLEKIVNILPVDERVIRQALVAGFTDFEDAIQNYTAKQLEGITVIITCNTKDYRKSDLGIHTPDSFWKTYLAP